MLGLESEAFEVVDGFRKGPALGLEPFHPGCLPSVQAFSDETAQPDYHVLEYAHRAYHGTVQPAENQRQDQDAEHHGQIEGEEGWQQLETGHPAPPLAADADKQQDDSDKKHQCQDYSDFAQHNDDIVSFEVPGVHLQFSGSRNPARKDPTSIRFLPASCMSLIDTAPSAVATAR